MSKVITFSRTFLNYHPNAGEPTFFVEKIYQCIWQQISFNLISELNRGRKVPVLTLRNFWDSLNQKDYFYKKSHTIRSGKRFKVGDKFSPRVWSGKPYASKQIIIAPDIEVKNVWDFDINEYGTISSPVFKSPDYHNQMRIVAKNDGLELQDFEDWLYVLNKKTGKYKPFNGQIICWNEEIEY